MKDNQTEPQRRSSPSPGGWRTRSPAPPSWLLSPPVTGPLSAARAQWLQRTAGNRATAAATTGAHDHATHVSRQVQGDLELHEVFSAENAAVLSSMASDRVSEIAPVFAEYGKNSNYYGALSEAYWGYARLASTTRQRGEEYRRSTEAELDRYEHLYEVWTRIRRRIRSDNAAAAQRHLARTRAHAEAVQVQLVYAYRQAILSGQDPADTELLGSGTTLKLLAFQVVALLNAINNAQAADVGRDVAPLVTVLNKALPLANALALWQQTGPLMSPVQEDIRMLRNAWTGSTTALSVVGVGKYLPFFAHVPICLGQIQTSIDTISRHAQRENRAWWALRDQFGDERLARPDAEIGGQPVHTYLVRVFRASSAAEVPEPSNTVVDFFDDRRDMFDTVEREVMGEDGDSIPTERSWIFFRSVDPAKLNAWVFDNRETVWRLVYGPGMDFP